MKITFEPTLRFRWLRDGIGPRALQQFFQPTIQLPPGTLVHYEIGTLPDGEWRDVEEVCANSVDCHNPPINQSRREWSEYCRSEPFILSTTPNHPPAQQNAPEATPEGKNGQS